jgi:hypothetical protein
VIVLYHFKQIPGYGSTTSFHIISNSLLLNNHVINREISGSHGGE